MPFENLSQRLQKTIKNISGQGKLTEANMEEMLREVRNSLLEADVNFKVATDFVARIKEKALGKEVLDSLNPGSMVVKIVRDELQNLLGQEDVEIHFVPGTTSIILAGLQGTGKTTASAKIAQFAKRKLNKKVLLVACDVIRPAAIEQLKTLGDQAQVDVFSLGAEVSGLETAKAANTYARENGYDLVIYDTAGRLHIDEPLMKELEEIKQEIQPEEILLTVDAMTGQDLVTVAKSFNDSLGLSGLVVTKMDGDARGGGLLSVRSITDVPVYFVSSGEKLEDLEAFHPDRMAERILGMGDVLSLVEQAQEKLDDELAAKTMDRLMSGVFTFNDMYDQLIQVNKMGSMKKILGMMPGFNQYAKLLDDDMAQSRLNRQRAIIESMTPYEREHPKILKGSRKKRIAAGSGVKVNEVNLLIKSLDQMQQLVSSMGSGMGLGGFPNLSGMAMPAMAKKGLNGFGTGRHAGSKKKKKPRKKRR